MGGGGGWLGGGGAAKAKEEGEGEGGGGGAGESSCSPSPKRNPHPPFPPCPFLFHLYSLFSRLYFSYPPFPPPTPHPLPSSFVWCASPPEPLPFFYYGVKKKTKHTHNGSLFDDYTADAMMCTDVSNYMIFFFLKKESFMHNLVCFGMSGFFEETLSKQLDWPE